MRLMGVFSKLGGAPGGSSEGRSGVFDVEVRLESGAACVVALSSSISEKKI
jgi:hypothetical protein